MAAQGPRKRKVKAQQGATTLEVLTIKELAVYLHVHPTTIYRLLREDKLPAFRVGANWRFRREEIDKWMLAKLDPVLRRRMRSI